MRSIVCHGTCVNYLEQITEHRHVLYQLVRQQITLRYRRTVLGYLWTLLNPLLMMSVTAVVFSAIFKMDLRTYAVFLFSGIIAFNLFSTIVVQSGQSLIGNEQLIKKIYIPKILFPLAVALALLIDSLLMFASLFVIIVAIGGKITIPLIGLIPAYFVLFVFSLGIALVVSISAVYFRDLQHIMAIFMQALIFLSPVYYKPELLSGKVEWLINLNPLTHFIELFRSPIYLGQFPSETSVYHCVMYAFASITVGIWCFSRHEHRVAFRM